MMFLSNGMAAPGIEHGIKRLIGEDQQEHPERMRRELADN